MLKSSFQPPKPPSGLHAAIIMDGNGRWATGRGKPRVFGHRAGASALRRAVEAAPQLGIRTLTVYAFSSDNWRRPAHEVQALMALLNDYLLKETEECVRKGLRVTIIGRRDRLAPALVQAIERTERATANGRNLHLRIAIDYSARDAIVQAAALCRQDRQPTREEFSRALARIMHDPEGAPEVDLLIRTGGEKRLSDFLLWECAYAELVFTDRMWPDFDAADLEAAVEDFHSRQRRFGAVPEEAAV